MVQEVQQPVVGVLGVVDDQDDGAALLAEVLEEGRPGGEHVLPDEGGSGPCPEQHREPRPQPVALGRVVDVLQPARRPAARSTTSPVSASTSPNRARIASLSAQNAMPSP